MIRRPLRRLALAAVALLAVPATALGEDSTSSNWAGYAAHGAGVHFRTVSAKWRQPALSCARPVNTYAAMWVGLGGFSPTSRALEQIGTEIDCTRTGRTVSSAWYELVPAPSVPIRMVVNPGDLLAAKVTLGAGRRVTLTLTDLTRHRTFRRTARPATVDDTAADWVLEAPSACLTATSCQTLPLADFGSAAFGYATATPVNGAAEPILSPRWQTTRITLAPGGRRFVQNSAGARTGGAATTDLADGGTAFSVVFQAVAQTGTQVAGAAGRMRDHPTRRMSPHRSGTGGLASVGSAGP